VTNLEDSLRDYYTTKADELSLPARVFDSVAPTDATVSYISMGPEPRRRTPTLLAAVASIALIAGAGVVVTRSSPSRGPRVVNNATTVASPVDFPLLAATWLPDGYVLTGASDNSDNSDNSYPAHTLIYRDPSQPLGSPAILISVDAPQPGFPGSEITIQGRVALDVSDEVNAGILVTDPLGVGITLSGHGVDMNQLRRVAETVKARSARPADGINIGGLPPGFEEVGDYVGTANSRMVDLRYSRPGFSEEQITVEVSNVNLGFKEILGVMSDSAPTPVTVRGQSGFQLHITTPFQQSTLAWQEGAQSVVAVLSPTVTSDVLLRVAEGLKSISPDELKQILSTTPGSGGLATGTNIDGYVAPLPATFTCADQDSTAPQGQRMVPCTDRFRPPLWLTSLGRFALSQIERTTAAPSDRWMLQYVTSVPDVDGVSDILLTIDAASPNRLSGFQSVATSPPMNARVVQTTIRGHEALIVSDPTGQNRSVGIAWMETPSQFIELESSRVSAFELRQMAEHLGPVSTDDWTSKIARNNELSSTATTMPAAQSTTPP
jgi:hypothetical protein